MAFMDDNFLLTNDVAKRLYTSYAKNMPICDYHCHLSPKEIYENKRAKNITELWLGSDHYKWRMMRSNGSSEDYCTGNKDDKSKFIEYARCLDSAIGNPLYSWSNMELKRYFGIEEYLSYISASDIYDRANEIINNSDFTPQDLIKKSNVKVICTTDDPIDDLEYHKKLRQNDFGCRVLPSFRPDRAINIENAEFCDYINRLGQVCNIGIKSYKDVILCLLARADYFDSLGCKISDQAFRYVPFVIGSYNQIEYAFTKRLNNEPLSQWEIDAYKTAIMLELGKKYSALNWAMELHIGVIRNNNTRMYNLVGADTGFDSVDDSSNAGNLSCFLNKLDYDRCLPKTILFNLNDKDNITFATMLGNFQAPTAESKLQLGPAWWFLDNYDGILSQLKYLANLGVLGKFVGMETDSRSFTSYVRHDYFRRILCDFIGTLVTRGIYPDDDALLKKLICDICYNNAIKYFEF